jgi:hypothetical protein
MITTLAISSQNPFIKTPGSKVGKKSQASGTRIWPGLCDPHSVPISSPNLSVAIVRWVKLGIIPNLSETGYQLFNEIGYQLKEDLQDFYSDNTWSNFEKKNY